MLLSRGSNMYIVLSHHDASQTHRLISHLLLLGCKVSVIGNPDRLINAIEENTPDVLFVGFPVIDDRALSVLNSLRLHPSTAALPLVVISSAASSAASPAGQADSHMQAIAAGCDEILKTPFSLADVEAVLSHFQDEVAS
jgi:CheY-like chemotaxis protein